MGVTFLSLLMHLDQCPKRGTGPEIGLRDFGLGEEGSKARARRWGMPEIGLRGRGLRAGGVRAQEQGL